MVLNEPLEGDMNEDTISNFESELCYTFVSPPNPRRHKVDIQCLYALEGRYVGVIMNNADSKSFISLNEVVPILHGKHISSTLNKTENAFQCLTASKIHLLTLRVLSCLTNMANMTNI